MVRQGGEHRPAVALRAARFERLGDEKVDLGLARRRQAVGHRAPHELVREAVGEAPARLLHEQPVPDGLVHGLEQDRLRDDLRPADGVQLEVGAGHRGELEHLVRLGREPGEPLVDDLPHGRRAPRARLPAAQGARPSGPISTAPASTSSRQSSVTRNALPPVRSAIAERSSSVGSTPAASRTNSAISSVRQPAQADPRDALGAVHVDERLGERRRHVGLGVAKRRDQQHPSGRAGADEVPQQLERRGVGPVDVLEYEQRAAPPS